MSDNLQGTAREMGGRVQRPQNPKTPKPQNPNLIMNNAI